MSERRVVIMPTPSALAEHATRRAATPAAPSASSARRQALRQVLVDAMATLRAEHGLTKSAAADWLIAMIDSGQASPSVRNAARMAARGGGTRPARGRLIAWAGRAERGEAGALAGLYKGRARKVLGWETRAAHLYGSPSRPAYATVAHWLRMEGWSTATYHAVRRYLKSLPSHLAETSKPRVGPHYYAQNIRPHVVRDSTVLPVGLIYEGDGHTCDVYVQHPRTGKPWRPELTVWLDVRSGYVVGWYLSEAESAHTTLYALSWALHAHQHVPAALHVDPGSGFINQIMTGDGAGFCARLSIQVMTTIPGNARGKGRVEGWFRHFEERCGKRFPTYCGHARTDDALRRLSTNIARGKLTLPTLAQYRDAVAEYVATYNATPQRNQGASPAELWAQLERTAVDLPAESLIRPREIRTVQRWGVAIHGRLYRAADLAAQEGRQVQVEYDLHDDARVWIYDAAGRPVCEAGLTEKRPWLEANRIEDLQQQRKRGQQRRLQARLDEVEARARPVIDHEAALDSLAELEAPPALPKTPGAGASPPAPEAGPGGVSLDLYRTDY